MVNENNKVKVIGYAKRVFYPDGIEYRNFSDNLVGNQLTQSSNGNSSVFTFGNFVTTINDEGRASRLFSTKPFGNFYTLDSISESSINAKILIEGDIKTTINLDNTNLSSFAYFGSATEYVRVSLEKIITSWPASLYLTPVRTNNIIDIVGDTFNDYIYDKNTNSSKFKVNVDFIVNNYDINYNINGSTINTFNEENDLRNLTTSYTNYVILINNVEYDVIAFTGSTKDTDDFIYFTVNGDPFGDTINNEITYHIKPRKELGEEFFKSLNEFESYLLDRLTSPKYTSLFNYKVDSGEGVIINTSTKLTWPVSDGYNLDFNTNNYINYVTGLITISESKDGIDSNLMSRFLTSTSISDFDSVPSDGTVDESGGQKMNKTLKIYGREFDEIKKYIDGISFANVVTYDKVNNIPDQLVKNLTRILGWDLTSILTDINVTKNYLTTGNNTYSGQSRGLTPSESEIELWRRLVLNSAFIWKSKGTRKAIEFFFKLIGVPDGLINFNEYVYVADEPIDMDLFYEVLEYNGLPKDISLYNVDADGYPKFFQDTSNMYFQKGGGWYRETAGSAATEYTLVGNNPHVGPYDRGVEYIAQLENIIPSFTAFTITSTTITTGTTQLFTNYNSGLMNGYSGQTYVDVTDDQGVDLSNVVLLDTYIQSDICPTPELNQCGCDCRPEDDDSLTIKIKRDETKPNSSTSNLNCSDIESSQLLTSSNFYVFTYKQYNYDGSLSNNYEYSQFTSPTCCETLFNGSPEEYELYVVNSDKPNSTTTARNITPFLEADIDFTPYDSGYICCNPSPIEGDSCGCRISCQLELVSPNLSDMESINGSRYLKFKTPNGSNTITSVDSCFCPISTGMVEAVEILDPYTNKNGYGCRLTTLGLNYFNTYTLVNNNWFYGLFKFRAYGSIGCSSVTSSLLIDFGYPGSTYINGIYE